MQRRSREKAGFFPHLNQSLKQRTHSSEVKIEDSNLSPSRGSYFRALLSNLRRLRYCLNKSFALNNFMENILKDIGKKETQEMDILLREIEVAKKDRH